MHYFQAISKPKYSKTLNESPEVGTRARVEQINGFRLTADRWYGKLHITHLQHSSNFPALLPAIHGQTNQFNRFLFHFNTTPPFRHLITEMCKLLYSNIWSCSASFEETSTTIATHILSIQRTHQNLTSWYLSTALSFQTEKTAFSQILSQYLLLTSLII